MEQAVEIGDCTARPAYAAYYAEALLCMNRIAGDVVLSSSNMEMGHVQPQANFEQ